MNAQVKEQHLPLTKLVKVPVRILKIHPTAQRALVQATMRRMRARLNLDAIGVFHAVEYPIKGVQALYVVDGQHRWHILMEKGLGDWVVAVTVHVEVKDDASASALFIDLNTRAPVHPYAKYVNSLNARHENAVGVDHITQANGFLVTGHSRDGQLSCVSSLLQVYDIDGGVSLAAAMETIVAAWGHTAAGSEGRIIEGLGMVYHTHNGTIDRPSLIKKLAKYPGGPSGLVGDARGLRKLRHMTVGKAVAERIIEAYNSGRHANRLDPV